MTPLRKARIEKGWTAIRVANESGATSESRLFQLERGRYRPRPAEAVALSMLLGKPVDDLFPGGVQNEEANK